MPAAPKGQLPFQWVDGVRLVGTTITCDPVRPTDGVCFLSHAHVPLPARTGGPSLKVICTERTLKLRAAAGRAAMGGALVTPFCRPFAVGRARVELLPAGHVPGAAQLLVEIDGRRILYAGDLNPRPGATAEAPQVRACDAIALYAPLLASAQPLPPRAETEARLVAAVGDAIAKGLTPIVLAPALGAAGEVALLLARAGLPLRVHRRIAAYLAAYRRLDIPAPTGLQARRLREAPLRGAAVLWPLEARQAPVLARLRRARWLLASGHASLPDVATRFGVFAAFPLADSGDLPSILEHVVATGARDVYLAAGYTDAVARAFATRGLRARPLGPPEQMPLLPTPAP